MACIVSSICAMQLATCSIVPLGLEPHVQHVSCDLRGVSQLSSATRSSLRKSKHYAVPRIPQRVTHTQRYHHDDYYWHACGLSSQTTLAMDTYLGNTCTREHSLFLDKLELETHTLSDTRWRRVLRPVQRSRIVTTHQVQGPPTIGLNPVQARTRNIVLITLHIKDQMLQLLAFPSEFSQVTFGFSGSPFPCQPRVYKNILIMSSSRTSSAFAPSLEPASQ